MKQSSTALIPSSDCITKADKQKKKTFGDHQLLLHNRRNHNVKNDFRVFRVLFETTNLKSWQTLMREVVLWNVRRHGANGGRQWKMSWSLWALSLARNRRKYRLQLNPVILKSESKEILSLRLRNVYVNSSWICSYLGMFCSSIGSCHYMIGNIGLTPGRQVEDRPKCWGADYNWQQVIAGRRSWEGCWSNRRPPNSPPTRLIARRSARVKAPPGVESIRRRSIFFRYYEHITKWIYINDQLPTFVEGCLR